MSDEPAMTTWTIGAATVTRGEEQLGLTHQPREKHFRHLERDVLERHRGWLAPDHYSPQHDRFVTSVHSWLIRLGDLTILLDTCGGNHQDPLWTHRRPHLAPPYLRRRHPQGPALDASLPSARHALSPAPARRRRRARGRRPGAVHASAC